MQFIYVYSLPSFRPVRSQQVTGRNLASDPRYGRRLDLHSAWPTGLMVEAPPSPKPWRGRTWSCESWRTSYTANLTADGGESASQDSPIGHWHGSGDVLVEEEEYVTADGLEEFKGNSPVHARVASRVSFDTQESIKYDDHAVRGREEGGKVGAGGGRVAHNGASGGRNVGVGGNNASRDNTGGRCSAAVFDDVRRGRYCGGGAAGDGLENVVEFDQFCANDGGTGGGHGFTISNNRDDIAGQNFHGAGISDANHVESGNPRRVTPSRMPAASACPQQRGAFGSGLGAGRRRVEVRTLDVSVMRQPVPVAPETRSMGGNGNSSRDRRNLDDGVAVQGGEKARMGNDNAETVALSVQAGVVAVARRVGNSEATKSTPSDRKNVGRSTVLKEKKTQSNRHMEKAQQQVGNTTAMRAVGGVEKSPPTQRLMCPAKRAARPTRETVRQWRHLFLL